VKGSWQNVIKEALGMFKKLRLTDRTRMLLKLELALTLPAVALMAFSIWNLKHIQRDQAIEAAYQRDFTYVLKTAESKSWIKANQILDPIRKEFPSPKDKDLKGKLDKILAEHPELDYAALYDRSTMTWVARMQMVAPRPPEFCEFTQMDFEQLQSWMNTEAQMYVDHNRMMAERGDDPVSFFGGWEWKKGKHVYSNEAFFSPAYAPKEEITLGIVAFNHDYLQKTFFPKIMSEVLNSKSNAFRSDVNPPAMMIHPPHDMTPWLASANWEGQKSEVDRGFTDLFQGLIWSIRYPGTTIADITAKFMRTNYIILGALSCLMLGGILLSYRNISREMNLARLKSDFVANVSHELRTPLALIRLYAETLELGRISSKEKYQEYYRIIREESERLSALINNILDFSRIEAGRKEYEFRETNLPELVRSTLDTYRFQIEQSGFAFEEKIATDIPPVNVDREAIARSLLNLVNNALKYSKDKKYIGVNLYRANGSVKLEVADHGIGIPQNEQEKIFEKFYRCGDPLVHNVKGSGLGLSLVRHIARAHGGDVQVESAPEKGSKFTIALPLVPPAPPGQAMA
jgi:signal transduction histidine kinase